MDRAAVLAARVGGAVGLGLTAVREAAALPDRIDLVEARIWMRLSQPRDNGLDKLAREPRDTLVLGLDAGCGLEHKPRYVEGKAKRQHQRQKAGSAWKRKRSARSSRKSARSRVRIALGEDQA